MHFITKHITKHITKLFTRFTPFTQEKKVLGRWAIDYCDKKTNNKIDLSNEDHCGPCGQYMLGQNEANNNPIQIRQTNAITIIPNKSL
jgi:hypothetical protein